MTTHIGNILGDVLQSRSIVSKTVVGIDASLTNTAVVIGDGERFRLKEFGSKSTGDSARARIERYDTLVADIVKFIESQQPIRAIYIEDYAFSRNGAGQSRLCELGGILRWHLVDFTLRVVEVKANTLKKFVTGKGNAPKDTMLAHIQKRWDQLFESNDAGDAYGLYKLGLCVEEIAEADTVAMREAVQTVKDSIAGMQQPSSRQEN